MSSVDANTFATYEEITSTLPSIQGPYGVPLSLYQGCWFPKYSIPAIMGAQDHFMVQPTDLFLCSFPKSGTTWLKALMFCVATRTKYPDFKDHPLLQTNPHSCITFIEEMYMTKGGQALDPNEPRLSPRILSCHMPYSILPESIRSSAECRIVYVCREPKDTLISFWKFEMRYTGKHVSVEDYFEGHLRGEGTFGPIWDHTLSYWRESQRNPNKVLFLKYEEMKKDAEGLLMRLAEFMGYPFSPEEEEDGVVRRIVEFCSFGSLSKLEVNMSDRLLSVFGLEFSSNTYFRKGEVGDWMNYLTSEMAKRFDDMVEAKLHGSGLSFNDPGSS